jgi:hypothetical protein
MKSSSIGPLLKANYNNNGKYNRKNASVRAGTNKTVIIFLPA